MTRIVLGSASSGRLQVLRHAGVEPLVMVSGTDEDAVIAAHQGASPDDVVAALAAAKADAVATALSPDVTADCVVIGCDSMLFIDGRLRGKPESPSAAREAWQAMAGRAGQLYTGHCLIRLRHGEATHHIRESAVTTVHFGTPSDAELAAYVDSGEPLQVAGGFTLDGLGGWFIDRIDGAPSNVIGLSLPLLRCLLHRADLSVAEVWAANALD